MNSQKFKCLTTRERIRLNSCSVEDFKMAGSPGVEKKAEDRNRKLQPIDDKSRINADQKRRIMKLN